GKAPGIDEAVRELGATSRATLRAGRDAGKAFRILVSADIALARSAFGRTLAPTGVAIAFRASAWLLLTATLIVGLARGLGVRPAPARTRPKRSPKPRRTSR